MLDRLLARPHLAADRLVAVDDLAHPLLDTRQILRAERLVAGEVVVEAVLDGRADGDLGAGKQGLHRFGEHVGAVVADHLQRIVVATGDEHHRGIGGDFGAEIDDLAVQLHRQRGAGEAGADGGGDVGARYRPVETADGTVGQGYGGHGEVSGVESGGKRAMSMAFR